MKTRWPTHLVVRRGGGGWWRQGKGGGRARAVASPYRVTISSNITKGLHLSTYVRDMEKKTSTKRVIHWEWGVMSGWCHFDPDKLCYLPGPRTSLGSYYLKEAPPPLGMSLQEWLTRLGIPLNKEIVTSLPLSPSVWSQTETPPGGSGCQRRENKYLFKALLTAPETLQLHYTTSISFIHRPRHCQEALECKIQPQSKADKGYKIKFIVTPYTRRNRGAPIVPRP